MIAVKRKLRAMCSRSHFGCRSDSTPARFHLRHVYSNVDFDTTACRHDVLIPVIAKPVSRRETGCKIIAAMYDDFFGKPYVFFKRNLPVTKIKNNSSCEPDIICLFTLFEYLLILLNQPDSGNDFVNRCLNK